MTTRAQVETWVKKYIEAWETAAPEDIEALFAEGAEYHEWPYETSWVGRAEIVEGWLSRQQWQEGGWSFDWKILMITGDTAAVRGTGVYKKLGTFENLWTVTFDDDGRCVMFRMWNNQI
ncbi:nuclear transport factor 2 family protein [Fodinicola feengrottensis]|uniref:SnoaL-like domain-containing protein n=1 Tax=Fodinicola feengrottensis TaxID=435914 RepID=A0ABN2IEI1_9ACTN|nr:nuclear transport factor 2 family protein [Fodinicola feengrottensis]